nr:SLAM family member 9-like [Pelodiscus sinensis]|eukprot:XP_006119485.1 SLAM family member 9-like [Pelodiscus sinensis]
MTGTPRPYLLFLLLAAQPRGSSPATSGCASSAIRVNGILGELVVLPFDFKGTFKLITWYRPSPRQDTASGRKVPLAVITPGEPGALPRVAVEDERYRGRVRLHGQSYSLEISNLTLADRGEYKLEQNTIGHNVHFCDYHLTLYQRLSQLEIKIHPVMAGNSTCNVTFTCSAGEGAWNLTYTWTGPAGGAVLSTKESLLVQHRLGDEDTPVTCTATNNVSTSSANASPKAACEGPTLPQTPALSYCRTKGLLVLGVLGSLLAGIVTAHVLAAREQTRPGEERSFPCAC